MFTHKIHVFSIFRITYAAPSMTHWSKCKMYLRRIISAHVGAGRHYRDYIGGTKPL